MTGDDVIVAVGDVAVLTCHVSGTPAGTTITFQWKRVEDISVVHGVSSAMYQVSSSASFSDMGVYTCEVTVSDEKKHPLVIPAIVSMNITLSVTGKRCMVFIF